MNSEVLHAIANKKKPGISRDIINQIQTSLDTKELESSYKKVQRCTEGVRS